LESFYYINILDRSRHPAFAAPLYIKSDPLFNSGEKSFSFDPGMLRNPTQEKRAKNQGKD
jgi:hypothetical protein